MFANFVYCCTTRGKKTTFDGKVVETVPRNANIYFAGRRYTVII